MIDNHLADQGQAEYQRKGECECGGSWESVEWCIEGEEECCSACEFFPHGGKCEYSTDKLRCKKCEAITEAE